MFLKSCTKKLSKSAGTQLRYMISLTAPMARVANSAEEPVWLGSCNVANWKTTVSSLELTLEESWIQVNMWVRHLRASEATSSESESRGT